MLDHRPFVLPNNSDFAYLVIRSTLYYQSMYNIRNPYCNNTVQTEKQCVIKMHTVG